MEKEEAKSEAPRESWAIVEVMGHRRLAGRISEASFAGAPFVKVETPVAETGFSSPETTQMVEQLYSPGSIFAITPCDEATARRYARAWGYQIAGYLPQAALATDEAPSGDDGEGDEAEFLGVFG